MVTDGSLRPGDIVAWRTQGGTGQGHSTIHIGGNVLVYAGGPPDGAPQARTLNYVNGSMMNSAHEPAVVRRYNGKPRRVLVLKGDQQLVLILIISMFVLGTLIPSCSSGSTKETDFKMSPPGQKEVMGNPIPLRRTDQNNGERCGPRYYTDVSGDDDYNPVCYELQLKLVKATLEGDLEAMREALRDGANPEGSVYDYYPPLHTAAGRGENEAVRLLLENGADLNRVADFENTPLNAAASQGHTDVVKLLVVQGADVCYKSSAGTAGDIARAKGHKELAELLKAAQSTKCK